MGNIVMRELACKLTDDELVQRGALMADKEMAIEREKVKRSKQTKKINTMSKERFDLATVIDSGEEVREVSCEWHEDFTQNLRRLVRMDTGDEVEQVTMTAAERQLMIESPTPGRDESIDIDDVPDDDDDDGDDDESDDDSDPANDEREVEEPRPTPVPRRPRNRPRQQQPSA